MVACRRRRQWEPRLPACAERRLGVFACRHLLADQYLPLLVQNPEKYVNQLEEPPFRRSSRTS